MSDTIFFRGENPLKADKLNLAFSERVHRTGDTMTGVLTLAGDPLQPLDAATKQYVDYNYSLALSGAFLSLTGGTMQGYITLHAGPTLPMHPVTKQYVDTAVTSGGAGVFLPLTGGTLTGPLTLFGTPTVPLHAATKKYVDDGIAAIPPPTGGGGASVSVSDTPPATPAQGDMWFDSVNAQLFLRYNDANSNQWVVANTASGAVATYGNVGRNLIYNSMFNVAQRGAGPFTTSGAFTADRWVQWFAGGSVSTQVSPAPDVYRVQIGDEACSSILYTTFVGTAGAGDLAIVQQNLEGVRRLGGKTVTVSFWAAGAGLKIGVSIDQSFGTGGSPSTQVTGVGQSVSLTGNFVRYSMTFAIPSTAGKTLGTSGTDVTQLTFWLSAGSSLAIRSGSVGVQSGSVGLWGVQLEVGTAATPMEKRTPQEELAECQRYYQIATCYVRANASGIISMMSPVYWPVMRATPTVVLVVAGSRVNIASPALTAQTLESGFFGCASSAAGDAYVLGEKYSLSADL